MDKNSLTKERIMIFPKRDMYFYADSLHGLLKQMDKKEYLKVHEMMDFYISEYNKAVKEVGKASATHAFHNLIDKKIKIWKEKVPDISSQIKCKRQCCHCCKISVLITEGEAELLKMFMDDNKENMVFDIERLKDQMNHTEKNWRKMKPNNKRCVFLNDGLLSSNGNNCMAYKYRPAACRKYFVLDDANKCDVENGIDRVMRGVCIEAEIIASAMLNCEKSDTMAKMIGGLL